MIGVTIGIGAEWEALARKTAKRMEDTTGLRCYVITADDYGCTHPSWLKCHIHRIFPDEDSYFVFDSDILPLREWSPRLLFANTRRPFIGVPEPSFNPDIRKECEIHGLGYPDLYINGGLLIYGREHTWIWDRVWSMHPNGGSWQEQTALNLVLADQHIEMMRLPRHFNLIAQRGKIKSVYARSTLRDAINVHTCAMKDPAKISALHDRILAYYESGQAGKTRIDLLFDLQSKYGYRTTGAELGVFEGEFSAQIQAILRPKALHLVDLFEGTIISGDCNGQNLHHADMRKMYDTLTEKFWAAQVHRQDAEQWLLAQPQHSLDWVYIDTSHEYEPTRAELEAALHAVRPGGTIAGHDFSQAFPEVIDAVLDFTTTHNKKFKIYDGDLLPSFAIEV